MSRILLTGGTGFLGSHLAEAIVAEGHDLVASVRASSNTRWLDPLGIETVRVDLARAEEIELARLLASFDTVVHCGGLTRARTEAEFMAVNAEGTDRLAKAARAAGVGRFVFISSLAARGPDDAGGPNSPYGRSKAEAERRLGALAGEMDVLVLRPGGVYGPRDSDLLPLFEMATRGWVVVPRSANDLQPVYVADVVSATLRALTAPAPAEPLPIAHGALHSWPALAAALGEAVGREGRVIRVPAGVFWTVGLISEVGAAITRKAAAMDRRKALDMSQHRWTCDVGDTRKYLGWTPEVDIQEGLMRTAAWYREHGWLA